MVFLEQLSFVQAADIGFGALEKDLFSIALIEEQIDVTQDPAGASDLPMSASKLVSVTTICNNHLLEVIFATRSAAMFVALWDNC